MGRKRHNVNDNVSNDSEYNDIVRIGGKYV